MTGDREFNLLLNDWKRALRARNRAPRTIQSYEESVLQLIARPWFVTRGVAVSFVSFTR